MAQDVMKGNHVRPKKKISNFYLVSDLPLEISDNEYDITSMQLIEPEKRVEFMLSLLQRLWEGSHNEDLNLANQWELGEDKTKKNLENGYIYGLLGLLDVDSGSISNRHSDEDFDSWLDLQNYPSIKRKQFFTSTNQTFEVDLGADQEWDKKGFNMWTVVRSTTPHQPSLTVKWFSVPLASFKVYNCIPSYRNQLCITWEADQIEVQNSNQTARSINLSQEDKELIILCDAILTYYKALKSLYEGPGKRGFRALLSDWVMLTVDAKHGYYAIMKALLFTFRQWYRDSIICPAVPLPLIPNSLDLFTEEALRATAIRVLSTHKNDKERLAKEKRIVAARFKFLVENKKHTYARLTEDELKIACEQPQSLPERIGFIFAVIEKYSVWEFENTQKIYFYWALILVYPDLANKSLNNWTTLLSYIKLINLDKQTIIPLAAEIAWHKKFFEANREKATEDAIEILFHHMLRGFPNVM